MISLINFLLIFQRKCQGCAPLFPCLVSLFQLFASVSPCQGLRSRNYIQKQIAVTNFRQKISQIILHKTTHQLNLIPNTIDFINSLYRTQSSSNAGLFMLSSLMTLLQQINMSSLTAFATQIVQLFHRISVEPSLDPTCFLRRIEALLKGSDICRKGDWALGMALLDACSALLASHDTQKLLRPLGSVLFILYSSHGDLDVRDSGMPLIIFSS